MKVYETENLQIAVEAGPVDETWAVQIVSPTKRAMLSVGGGGPESSVAMDLLSQMAEIHELGVAAMIKRLEADNPDADYKQLKKTTSELFAIADEIGGRDGIETMVRAIQGESIPEPLREVASEFRKLTNAKFEFPAATIEVRFHSMVSDEVANFYVRLTRPGTVPFEDLMKRPVGYFISQIAKENLSIMRSVLAAGVPASAQRFLKANYLGPDYLSVMTKHAENILRFATAVGDADLAKMEEAMEPEVQKEEAARVEIQEKAVVGTEKELLARLERREQELVEQIQQLRKIQSGQR